LKSRVVSSPGYAGLPVYVVYANVSGIGSLCCCTMYWPVFRCHHVSVSLTSREKAPTRKIAASTRIAVRNQEGGAAGIECATGLTLLSGEGFAGRGGMMEDFRF